MVDDEMSNGDRERFYDTDGNIISEEFSEGYIFIAQDSDGWSTSDDFYDDIESAIADSEEVIENMTTKDNDDDTVMHEDSKFYIVKLTPVKRIKRVTTIESENI